MLIKAVDQLGECRSYNSHLLQVGRGVSYVYRSGNPQQDRKVPHSGCRLRGLYRISELLMLLFSSLELRVRIGVPAVFDFYYGIFRTSSLTFSRYCYIVTSTRTPFGGVQLRK